MELTEDQARRIAKAISIADGGCTVCVGEVCDAMAKEFPGHDWHALAGLDPVEP